MKKAFLIASLLLMLAISGTAQTNAPLLLQKPTISRTQIAFAYAGDLWTVSREGGNAERLTTGAGTETDPIFSPDGNYDCFHRRIRRQC